MAKLDTISEKWPDGRGPIEDFQLISDGIEEYLESHHTEFAEQSEKMSALIKEHIKLLQKGRALEQHIRDTIQINVGNLPLQSQSNRQTLWEGSHSQRLFLFRFRL
jgi:hypothetical protein